MYPFDTAAARIYARVLANLARRGMTIGSYDLMIGATCISLGFSVATLDFRDFEKIPGVKVEKNNPLGGHSGVYPPC